MAELGKGTPFPWPEHFQKNRARFPAEELWKYAGQQIAWNWDGTKIVAAGRTYDELFQTLEAMKVDLSKVIIDYVEEPGVSYVGGLCDSDT